VDEISLREVWRALVLRRALIAAAALAGLLSAAGVSILTRPVYRAEVLLAPVEAESRGALSALAGQFGGLAALAGVDLGADGDQKDEAVALLRSRTLAMRFIEEQELLPVLFAADWDATAGAWKPQDADDIPTLWDAYRLFDEEIRSVDENPRTGLVTLAIEWTEPERARAWAEGLVARVNAETRARATREAERSLSYLNAQLQKTDLVELRQAIFTLVESQTKQMMLANVREDYAFKVIDPAVVPDRDDPVRPRPLLLLPVGLTAGLLFGVLIALLAGAGSGFRAGAR